MADALNPFGSPSAMPKDEIKDLADWAELVTKTFGSVVVEASFIPFRVADRLGTGACRFLKKVLGAFIAERNAENPIIKGFARLACSELENGKNYNISIADINALREGKTPTEYDSARSFIDFCHQSGSMEWGEVTASGYKFQRVETPQSNQYAIYQEEELVASFEFDLDGKLIIHNSFSEDHPLRGDVLRSNSPEAERSWSLISDISEARRQVDALEISLERIKYSEDKGLEPKIQEALDSTYQSLEMLGIEVASALTGELQNENPLLQDRDVREAVTKAMENSAAQAAGRGDLSTAQKILGDIQDILQENRQAAISDESDDRKNPDIRNIVNPLNTRSRELQRLLRVAAKITDAKRERGESREPTPVDVQPNANPEQVDKKSKSFQTNPSRGRSTNVSQTTSAEPSWVSPTTVPNTEAPFGLSNSGLTPADKATAEVAAKRKQQQTIEIDDEPAQNL